MQKCLFILSFLLNGLHLACAQNGNPIVVQHGDLLSYANSLDNALSIAVAGDAIYLPAGSFSTQSGISKKVSIYGVGYRRDMADISGVTQIIGDIGVNTGAEGSLISGVFILNTVVFFGVVPTFNFSNCNITRIVSGYNNGNGEEWNCRYNGTINLATVNIKESIIGNLLSKSGFAQWCPHRIYFNIQNSIIQSQLYGDYYTTTNCVILNIKQQ